jgi:hypothetical protein
MDTPKLGDTARDMITGFEGAVTGRAEYITGCAQLLIQSCELHGGDTKSCWFDEARVRLVNRAVFPTVDVSGPDPGGPAPGDVPTRETAPIR